MSAWFSRPVIYDPARSGSVGLAGRVLLCVSIGLGLASGAANADERPSFDLIFVDEPPAATPTSLTRPQEPESPQREDVTATQAPVVLRAQTEIPNVAIEPESVLAREFGTLQVRDLPPMDPVGRLASLSPPKATEATTIDLRARLVGTDVTLPLDEALPDDDLATLSPVELARELQSELARVGCYRLRVDGQWGPGSRRALTSYLNRSNQSSDGQEPTPELVRMVRESEGEVCPAPVAQAPAVRATPSARTAPQPARPAPAAPQRQVSPAPAAPAPSGGASRLGDAIRGGFR